MAYTKTNWVDGVTPLSAGNMNKIENKLSSLDTEKANAGDVTTGLDGKVDKVAGKGLSTEDYTTAEKNSLALLGNLGKIVKIRNSANFGSFSGGVGTLEYDTIDQDDFGVVDLTNFPTRLTVPNGVSLILLKARIYASSTWTSSDYWGRVYMNGSLIKGMGTDQYLNGSNYDIPDITVSLPLSVSAGDYFEIKADLNTFGAGCYLEMIVLK